MRYFRKGYSFLSGQNLYFNLICNFQVVGTWEVIHIGKGFLVNRKDFEELQEIYSLLHADFARGKDRTDVNPRLRGMIKNIRKLLWPGISFKAYNFGTKGLQRPQFHIIRESLAQGYFL